MYLHHDQISPNSSRERGRNRISTEPLLLYTARRDKSREISKEFLRGFLPIDPEKSSLPNPQPSIKNDVLAGPP